MIIFRRADDCNRQPFIFMHILWSVYFSFALGISSAHHWPKQFSDNKSSKKGWKAAFRQIRAGLPITMLDLLQIHAHCEMQKKMGLPFSIWAVSSTFPTLTAMI